MSEDEDQDDYYRKNQELGPEGLYQLAAEEARRPGAPGNKQRRILSRLAALLELPDEKARLIEDLAEQKRATGKLGPARKFARRQLYARTVRYAYGTPEPSPRSEDMLAKLRMALDYQDEDHERVMEQLIDQGWAPPRPLPARAERVAQAEARRRKREEDPEEKAALEIATERMKKVEKLLESAGAAPLPPEEVPSSHELKANLFETMSGLPSAPPEPKVPRAKATKDPRQPFVVGLAIGAVLALLPVTFFLGTRWVRPPPPPTSRPSPPPPATAPSPPPATVAPVPTTPPSAAAVASRPPVAADPRPLGERLLDTLPPLGSDGAAGLAWLSWLQARMAERAQGVDTELAQHLDVRRREVDRRFAQRNEAIFQSSRDMSEPTRFDPALIQEGVALVRAAEDEPKLAQALVHSWFLGLLAFYTEPRGYLADPTLYQGLARVMVDGLRARPVLAKSGGGLVVRVIGEDLRDSEREELQVVGREVLDRLPRP